jgi:endonuclease YncB( thermonuclease family)
MFLNCSHLILAAVFLAAVASLSAALVPEGWTALEDCRLAQADYADGDSFHVIHRGRNHQFRLYFVDCPETDMRFPERIEEQMKDFGLDANGVVAAGHLAHDFTSHALSQPFTVLTKWEDARGASAQERFYAVVFVGNKNLAEELVRSGLARAYGMYADYPSEVGGRQFVAKLRRLQNQAARSKVGAFAQSATIPPSPHEKNRPYADPQGIISDRILEEGVRSIEVDSN